MLSDAKRSFRQPELQISVESKVTVGGCTYSNKDRICRMVEIIQNRNEYLSMF